MDTKLYDSIFRRKSFHIFRERLNEHISNKEILDIKKAYKSFDSLKDIKTAIKIVKAEETTCNRNEEYCIMMFSEEKDGYLQNIGYLGEQLDLYLVSKNIGSLWYGIAKSDEVFKGMKYVIMIAIAKVSSFRKDMYKSKRKSLKDIWSGKELEFSNIVRYAPSACNSQPWFVEHKDNELLIYRITKTGRIGIMPKNVSIYYNQIDIGIFLCFIELCLLKKKYKFKRKIIKDTKEYNTKVLNTVYTYK